MDLWPLITTRTIEFSLWDGNQFLTGVSPTLKIVRISDGWYWTGAAWQSGSATVSPTEFAQFSGRYRYTLTGAAVGVSVDTFFWEAVYGAITERGSFSTVLNDCIQTAVNELGDFQSVVSACDAAISSRLSSAGYTAPDNAGVSAIKTKTDQLNFTGTDVKATLDSETVKLSEDGLDAITTTAPAGVASNFREMVVQVWRRFFKKATKSSTQILTYADDGSTVVTTQAISASGTDESQGAAA